MSVWMIAWANIRRKKSVAVSMGILILLSAAMFNVGLTLFSGISSFYERENDRMSGAHYQVRFYGDEYEDSYLDYMEQDSRVEAAQRQNIVIMDMAEFKEGGVFSYTFKNMDEKYPIVGYTITERMDQPDENGVYLPYFMQEMGYQTGETLDLIFNRQKFQFPIAGFYQSTWFASSVSSMVDVYMPDSAYESLFEQLGGGYMLSVRLHDQSQAEEFRQDFKHNTGVRIEAISMDSKTMDFTVEEMRTGCTMVVTILSAVLFAFSFLMVIVSIIVMKFRITNHLESQMANIGALEAMGYTGAQIKWSIALEFLMVGFIGTVLGIGVSYGIIGGLGQLITASVGVSWKNGGHLMTDVVSGTAVMSVLLLVSQAAAGKAARILPVQALRQGMESHSFRKNYFPLEKGRGPVNLVLGLKQVMFHKKTYLMTGVIFAGISFACAFAVAIFMNLGINDDLIYKMTGYEISDIMVAKAPHMDYDRLKAEVGEVAGVRKTSLYEGESVTVEGKLLTCYVSDNFDNLETVDVYEGTFPRYDNEIVVTGVLAKEWGKRVGDTVLVQGETGAAMEFVICGLGQTMSNFGRQCYISDKGFLLIVPTYEKTSIQVYLEPGQDVGEVMDRMENQFRVLSPSLTPAEDTKEAARRKAEEKIVNLISMYGMDSVQYALIDNGEIVLSGGTEDYEIDHIDNTRRMFMNNVNSISSATRILSGMIVAGTLLIIVLVFYMVIKSMLVRRRHEFGIYKSLGYTDEQLMRQIAVSFLPSSVLGTMTGLICAYLSVNRLFSILFEGLGISRFSLTLNPWVMMLVGCATVLFSYMISVLVSGKMKTITVYGLLTEV